MIQRHEQKIEAFMVCTGIAKACSAGSFERRDREVETQRVHLGFGEAFFDGKNAEDDTFRRQQGEGKVKGNGKVKANVNV